MDKLIMLLLAMVLFSCNKENTKPLGDSTLTGKWRLIRYDNLLNGTSEAEPAGIPLSVI
jgi:hypothetical protein